MNQLDNLEKELSKEDIDNMSKEELEKAMKEYEKQNEFVWDFSKFKDPFSGDNWAWCFMYIIFGMSFLTTNYVLVIGTNFPIFSLLFFYVFVFLVYKRDKVKSKLIKNIIIFLMLVMLIPLWLYFTYLDMCEDSDYWLCEGAKENIIFKEK